MVSRDYIKRNKKRLQTKHIKGVMLKRYETKEDGTRGRKFTLIPKWRMDEIKKQEVNELVILLKDRNFKNQKRLIDERVPIANRENESKLGVELGRHHLKRLYKLIEMKHNEYGRNRLLLNYLNELIIKAKEEEIEKIKHKERHDRLVNLTKEKPLREGLFGWIIKKFKMWQIWQMDRKVRKEARKSAENLL
jgi:hypothetical protein